MNFDLNQFKILNSELQLIFKFSGRSVADRSGAEIVETGHFINREAYFRSEAYEE